jgi:hypothetical protein
MEGSVQAYRLQNPAEGNAPVCVRTTLLSRVVGVDVNVLVGKVGGPENAAALALMELDGD